MLSSILLLAARVLLVSAQIASLPFQDCSSSSSSSSPPQNRINISTIYAQISHSRGHFLNLTLLGQSGAQVLDYSNSTLLSSTIFAPTSVLTFTLSSQYTSSFCHTLRPPSPLPQLTNPAPNASANYCPLPPGPIAFAVGTPLSRSYELMTLNTQIRVLDTSSPAQELACLQVPATPLTPSHHSVYGHAIIVFWATVALAVAYWLVVGAARLAAAWKRGRQRVHNDLWSHVQGVGFVLASAISGERFASSPSLMRFGTPSMRDVVFHTQWCTLLGMVTVQWPRFTYPYFAQTAWATLLYNISLTQGSDSIAKHWDPLHTDPFNPPSAFADQLADPTSPLFINTSVPNTLFTLPNDIPQTGIPALAAAVGIRPQDAFNTAVSLFVLILGGTIILSVFIFAVDRLLGSLVRATERRNEGASGTRTPPWASATHKEFDGSPEPVLGDEDLGAGNVRFLHRPSSRTLSNIPSTTGWLSQRLGQSSFHGSVLHGNLVRILILFHLPVSTFSCYQFSSGKAHSSLAAVILAALAFAVFSISIPAWLVLRLTTTPTSKLYDETRTLLSLGPLYNHYAHGSQLFACLFFASNIAYSVALGCGQQSGTAQSIIILVVEVVSALTTSVWLPWGRGATMGGISFMLCVARIITAVLLVILSPIVSVGDSAGGWIAYAILVIQALVYLAFLLMLIFKVLEGFVRLIWDVSFDRSKHTVDTGLIGAIGLAGCCGSRRKSKSRRAHHHHGTRPSRPSHAESDSTTQGMLPPVLHANASHSRTTVSGPPSVLRPEQLNQPYREDSDDEGGYILGAWHYDDEPPDPRPASPVVAVSAAPKPSGFSRVAGGRANIDSPYTMTAASAGTSAAAAAFGSGSAGSTRGRAASPGPSVSAGNLPPGAMAPGRVPQPHARTKSQSAIIEESAAAALREGPSAGVAVTGTKGRLSPVGGGGGGGGGALGGSSDARYYGDIAPHGGEGALPPVSASKRRNWLNLFTSSDERDGAAARPHRWGRRTRSEAAPMLPDESTSAVPPEPASPGPSSASSPAPASASGGRTFVVIRDRRPSPLSQAQVPGGQDPDEGTSSFSVVRPHRAAHAASASGGDATAASAASPPASLPAIPSRSPQRRRDATS